MDAGRDDADSGDGERGARVRLSIDLPEGAVYVVALRQTVRCLLLSAGVARWDVEDVEVILGELATNAVLHAGGTGGYRVEMELHAGWLQLTVSDSGPGFPASGLLPSGAPRPGPAGSPGDGSRLGGWGLPLVRGLADHVEILPAVPHGTVVRVEKRWSGPLPSDRASPCASGFS